MSDTYTQVRVITDVQLAPGVDPLDKWKYLITRRRDNLPICICSSKQAAEYIETLLNDRPFD